MHQKTRALGKNGRRDQIRRARVRYAWSVLEVNMDAFIWLTSERCEGLKMQSKEKKNWYPLESIMSEHGEAKLCIKRQED